MSNTSVVGRIPVCEHGSSDFLSRSLIQAVSELEGRLGFELHFNSGFRCAECNRLAGGKPNSAHLRGLAADVAVPDSNTRFLIVSAALRCGFRRVGVGSNFVHLDCDESLPQGMLWVY